VLDLRFAFKRSTRPAAARVLLRSSDGDTPLVEQPIRMVSCDTPEKAGYAGGPIVAQAKLDVARERLAGGFYDELPAALRRHFIARLGPGAALRHLDAGQRASEEFERLLARRLLRPDGTRRALAVVPTGELIDRYGRLLAYFAPYFRKPELPPKGDPERRTFNCDMVALGWSAFFPLYPSLPSDDDLALVVAAAIDAWTRRLGAWHEFGSRLLLAYEYRMAIKLAEAKSAAAGIATAFQRSCVDLRNRRDVGRFGWTRVPPPYRLWYWLDDTRSARADLGVVA
jgi:endonuclease YncB( thermonuclease family)